MKPMRWLLLCCAVSWVVVPAAAQAAGVPVATAVPAISGTPSSGQTLTTTAGTWSNAPTTYRYQWSACDAAGANCAAVGTNSASLVLTAAQRGRRIRVSVTASNAYGSATSTSGAMLAVDGPYPITAPVISGVPASGYRLHATSGTWNNAPTSYAYRWESCDAAAANCATIGVNDADFVVTSAERGRRIRVTVTATNAYGSTGWPSVASAAANSPMPAPPKTNQVLSAGGAHTCAVKAGGTPVCWGLNGYGQASVPAGIGRVTQITTGDYHSCAIKDSGTPVCWGANSYGQLAMPTAIGTVTQISAGDNHTCAVRTNAAAICWGDNSRGQVTVPASVGPVTQVSAGRDHSCATRINGTAICWGDGYNGGTVPAGLGGITEVSAGDFHSCAIKTNGAPTCWGYNSNGQATVPAGIGTVTQLSGGYLHACAVKTNGAAACWGDNRAAQSAVPAALGTVKQISAGLYFTCAVKTNGTATCWGDGTSGQTAVPGGVGSLAATSVASAAPEIGGTLSSGNVLRTNNGAWINGVSSYAYQWMSCDSAVANCRVIGTNSQNLTLTTAERGRRIRATVIATNSFGTGSRDTAATAVIA